MRNRGLLIIVLLILMSSPQLDVVQSKENLQVTPSRGNSLVAQDSADNLLRLQWWSRDSPSPKVLEDGTTIIGDQITVQASFDDSHYSPGVIVDEVRWSASRGFIEHRNGELIIPYDGYEPFIMGLEIDQLGWERIDGIQRGDNVSISLTHNNTDTDVLVYWADIDPSLWMTDGGLTGRDLATARPTETGSFIADHDGAIMVGIYSYDHQPGTFNLSVDTREEDTGIETGNQVRYNTWSWGRNVTISMEFKGLMANGTTVSRGLSNLTINGFFNPVITNVRVLPFGLLRYVVWDVLDRNQNDAFEYEFLVSLDGGVSFMLLASGFNDNFYEWNTGGFDAYETCIIQIRAIDSTGLTCSGFSETFSVGAKAYYAGTFWFATSSSGNSTYAFGTSENRVSWEIWIQNNNPMMYEILLDNEVIRTGWTVSGLVEVDADGLALGLHSFTLSLIVGTDTWNDSLFVEVIPNPALILVQLIGALTATSIISIAVVLYEFFRRVKRID